MDGVEIGVLLTGTDGWAVDRVARGLEHQGLRVLPCHDTGGPSWPCRGLADGRCPVDDEATVAVTVRAHPLPQPARRETGVVCAVRHGLPLVVVGSTVLHPFADLAVAEVDGLDVTEIAATVERVARQHAPLAGAC